MSDKRRFDPHVGLRKGGDCRMKEEERTGVRDGEKRAMKKRIAKVRGRWLED